MIEDDNLYSKKNSSGKPQCIRCGKPVRLLSAQLVEKIYGKDGDVKGLSKMCPLCRRKAIWEGCVSKI